MRRLFAKLLLSASILGSVSGYAGNFWQQVDAAKAPAKLQVMHPTNFLVYVMDEANLKVQLWNVSQDPNDGMILSLPLPNGGYRDFKVWGTPMMPDVLAAKYLNIRTFTGEAVGNRTVTAKIDFTDFGFHAMIFDGDNTCFIDPYDNYQDGFYMVHYKKDETRALTDRMHCEVKGENDIQPGGEPMITDQSTLPQLAHKTINGATLRSYRAAISCSNQYAVAATGLPSPTIAQTLSKMTTSLNRVNGVYNREFSVQMTFVANEDTLIWTAATGTINGNDPFNTINSNGNSCLGVNQTTCHNRIGDANYDFGHVFTTGGGGVSSLGVVCNNGSKAKSCTGSPSPVGDGYDIDYVAHEMGHEFGSNHTFNDNTNGSCATNAVSSCAYEPGSGATIMDYAGICSPDDLQLHSDAYFSASSVLQITAKLAGSENACAVTTSTGNLSVGLGAFSASYTIPYKTPFELTGPVAVDSAADTATTYGWAQWNLGGTGATGEFGKTLDATHAKGPIFRSFNPEYDPTRVFPKLSMILAGTLTSATSEGNMGEKVPDTARYLTFKMAVRAILNGKGCFTFPDDSIHIDAVSTPTFAGFKVTSQGTTGISYTGGTTQTITWDVVGTDAAPVSAAYVNIYLSTDAGKTWPYYAGTFPNTGTADITVPNPAATSATSRFKVKGAGNVFFNLNLKNITVVNDPSLPVTSGVSQTAQSLANNIKVYPVPATDEVHISVSSGSTVQATVYNTLGQQVWHEQVNGSASVSVRSWPRGTYYMRLTDANGGQTIKSVLVD
jgi:hypothetical protein